MASFEEIFNKKYRDYGGYPELRNVQISVGPNTSMSSEHIMEEAYELYQAANTIVKKFIESEGENIIDDSITMIDAPENVPFHKMVSFRKIEGLRQSYESVVDPHTDEDYSFIFLSLIQFTDRGMEVTMYNSYKYSEYLTPQECNDHYPDYEHTLCLDVNKVLITPEGVVSKIVVRNNFKRYVMGSSWLLEDSANTETMIGKLCYIRNILDTARQKKTIKR